MQTLEKQTVSSPVFPRPLAWPIALILDAVHGLAVVTALNRIFAGALRAGELDFLQGRVLRVHVSDLPLTFCLSLHQARLVTARRAQAPDLSITGSLHAFLLLAARREDADTLFFQRRLRMEGDTELGLGVKNFLDGLDLESLWLHRQLGSALRQALPFYERLFS
jgi:O2-independent ubiquinone biosynthesis accessory factor UbiT